VEFIVRYIKRELLFEPDERPFGRPLTEWTVEWWKWLLSIPKPDNPALDSKNKTVGISRYNEDVLFVAGTTGGSIERELSIPAGKAILLGVINFTTSYSEEPHLKNDLELIARAKSDIDDIVNKDALIDGEKINNLDDYRISSSPFDLVLPEKSLYGAPSGSTRGISDGYWLFLKPLTPGKHEIITAGSCSLGKTSVRCTYRFDVA
jgi:hypothetical protein